MSQFQAENEYFEQEEDDRAAELYDLREKRKRIAYQEFDSRFQPQQYQRSPAAEIVAWAFVGLVGFVLAVGSTIIAANNQEEWVIVVPLVYMLGAMRFMRR